MQWKGVFPALTTKFKTDDSLDLPLTAKNINAQIDAGVDGIILGGTLGESSVLTISEKETLIKFAVEQSNRRVPVVLNIAEGSTGQSNPEQVKFIGYAQRSALEVVNCLYLANKRNYIDQIEFDKFYNELERLVAKIQAFKNSLK